MASKRILGLLALVALLAAPVWAQGGQIEGKITRANGDGLGGVTIVVNELGAVEISQNDGSFSFTGVPAGTYSVSFTLGNDADTATDVEVAAGESTELIKSVDWDPSFAETITVYSASRRRERIVDAPAAVTVINEEKIAREATSGQVPKLLEFTPGVEVAQSGVFDFNLNARGFNSSINRRVVVLIDGRDPSVPFLASQEWAITSQYMKDLSNVEMIRGPSSALYGANAYNGVLNLVTKSPRLSQGGEIELGGGELSTFNGNFRWAGDLGNDWYIKLNGAYFQSDDWSQDRIDANGNGVLEVGSEIEYAGLPGEAVRRIEDQNEITFGNVRVDKVMSNGDFFTIESGLADANGPALQTAIGRFSVEDTDRSWFRANYTSTHFNVLGYYNEREALQTNLGSGAPTALDSNNFHISAQTNWDFSDGRVRFVAGVSYEEEEIDTTLNGVQTLVFSPVDADSQAVFAQVDFDLTDNLKLVIAGRYDDSSLHDSQVSPKGALVWSITDNHTLRFSYNEAFQVPNYSEFFLYANVGFLPGSLVDGLVCGSFGISCGLDPIIPVIASGTESLELEEVESIELGYSGIIGNKAFLTVDYYQSDLRNFITDPLPQLGTSLGQINPAYVNFSVPGVPGALNAALLATVQALTGGGQLTFAPDGSQVVIARAYANFGEVETQGLDIGLGVFFTPEWRLNVNYSWFDFEIQEELPDDPLVANAPENKGSISLSYVADTFDVQGSFRWVEEFDWAAGVFIGEVESFELFDLSANFKVTDNITIGALISNLFDEETYQTFGGDLIGRRAIGSVKFTW
ncbi:MAG: TonB-dependent receptor [Acidobacteriota bacterium]